MAAMIRHTVSEPKKSFLQTIGYIISGVLAVNILVELTNHLPRQMANIVSLGILVGAGLLSSYLVNRKLAKYTYILIDDEIIFYKQIGSREKKILDIKLQDIDWIEPIEEGNTEGKRVKTYSLGCKLKGEGVYLGQYQEKGRSCRFIFQPSTTLYRELVKQVNRMAK